MEKFLLVSLLVEAIVENILWVFNKEFYKERVLALAIAVAVCVLTSADLLALVGLTISVPYVGSVLTGILTARGANAFHLIVKKLAPPVA